MKLQARRDAGRELEEPVIEERRARLEPESRRPEVNFREQVVGEVGTDVHSRRLLQRVARAARADAVSSANHASVRGNAAANSGW